MSFSHAFVLLGAAACLSAQTPAPPAPKPAPATSQETPAPNKSFVPHVELSMDTESVKLPPVPPDRVVISVGDVKVTAAQFDLLIESLPPAYRNAARGAGRKQFADNVVRTLVLAQDGKRRKLDETPLYQVQAMFQLASVLANLTYQQIGKETKVEDAELRRYFDEHKADFEQISARHILIRMQGSTVAVKPGQKDLTADEALAKAKELEARIKAGEDFAKLAMAESDDTGSAAKGGDLGFFPHGQMVPSFEQAAFALAEGQVSEPVLSQFGYHIIKVEKVKTFADVKADVEKRLLPELVHKTEVDLQKSSVIVYDTEFFNMARR